MTRDERQIQLTGETEWLTSSELQAWLRLGRTKTFELLNDPERGIPNYRLGRKIVARRQDVEDWLEQNRYHSEERR